MPIYRAPQSPHPIGKELDGGYVVTSVEDHLVQKIKDALDAMEGQSNRTQRYQSMEGRMYGLIYALATVQSGSSYFDGNVTRELERSIFAEWRAEKALERELADAQMRGDDRG